MLRLTFHGAARSVTGSCYRLETAHGQILIDCGLFQGSKTEKELNYRDFPFNPRDIDAVILTHAHIDHSGLLPKLVRHGYSGPIHATDATTDLAEVMLADSAHIQEIEVEQLNRRSARRRSRQVTPIYGQADATACMKLFRPAAYKTWIDILPGVRARFWNAGHLLGSASVEIECQVDGSAKPLSLLFSGDIGPDFKLLQPDPEGPAGVDCLICEATYGDTDRQNATAEDRRRHLCDEVRAAMQAGGALIIPSFAVERAQEVVSDIIQLIDEGLIPRVPIFIDSPLAAKATRVFLQHAHELEGGQSLARAFSTGRIHFTETPQQSIALDERTDFHIVIAASGMCEAGRIRYRLKNWIWREQATVLMVGYQAVGTLGRILLDGAKAVRIQGDEFAVRARIRLLDLYSGHADGPELVKWIAARMPVRQAMFLTHGEEEAIAGLQSRLGGAIQTGHIFVPALDQTFVLEPGRTHPAEPAAAPRLPPERIARLDWHNDVSKLFLDINDVLLAAPDERERNIIIRRLRRALEENGGDSSDGQGRSRK